MTTYLFRALFVLTIFVSLFTTGVASAALTCPTITRTLSFGSRGADVTALQTYLATDKNIYPEGIVSGYFGRGTEKAVQRFQTSRKIVTSGTPSTTGYGSVGGKTRAALAACNSGATAPSTVVATSTPASTTPSVTPTVAVTTQVPQTPLVTFTDGATTTITLGSGITPSLTTFSFAPRSVDLTNDPVSMYWISANSTTCNVEKLTGSSYETVQENAGSNGSISMKVAKSPVTYSLNCIGKGDNSTSTPGSIRRDVMVTINNPVPTCTVTTDKSAYKYATDSIKISWVTTGADSVSWEHGVASDPVALPYGNLYPTGSIFASSLAGSSQTIKLNVAGYGGTATCSASFSINSNE